jgi:hypothetical protein
MANTNGIKEMNDTVTNYTATATTQILEFNTKLWNDYLEFTKKLVTLVPSVTAIYPTNTSK